MALKRALFSPGTIPVLLFPALSFLACAPGMTALSGNAGSPGPALTAAVSIPPQAWFVRRIAGDRARVLTLAGPGQNPHNYEASPRQLAELSRAAFWVLSGAEFEISLRPRIAAIFPGLAVVDGTEGIRWRILEEAHDHDDGDGGHGEGGIDRHSWLGREPALILAGHIRDALCAADPANAGFYQANAARLFSEINAEFDRLKAELAPLRGTAVFVYHPAFGYFLDEFGIRQEAVETGGKEPGPRALYRLIAEARREGVRTIFVQAQFPVNSARTAAAAAGAELAALDPLAEDWPANIRAMGAALKQAAGGK